MDWCRLRSQKVTIPVGERKTVETMSVKQNTLTEVPFHNTVTLFACTGPIWG